jgi:hypothetical protein
MSGNAAVGQKHRITSIASTLAWSLTYGVPLLSAVAAASFLLRGEALPIGLLLFTVGSVTLGASIFFAIHRNGGSWYRILDKHTGENGESLMTVRYNNGREEVVEGWH